MIFVKLIQPIFFIILARKPRLFYKAACKRLEKQSGTRLHYVSCGNDVSAVLENDRNVTGRYRRSNFPQDTGTDRSYSLMIN